MHRLTRMVLLFLCLSCFSWFLLPAAGSSGRATAQAPGRLVVFESFLNAG